jgi:hypothetical protein
MREPAERVGVDSMKIGIGLMGEVQSVADGQGEEVAEVVLVQLKTRGEGERTRMVMQSGEATGRADAAVEIVVVEVVVVVDKSSSGNDQRSIKDGCNIEGKVVGRSVNFKFESDRRWPNIICRWKWKRGVVKEDDKQEGGV